MLFGILAPIAGLSRTAKRSIQVLFDTILIAACFGAAMVLRHEHFAFDPRAWIVLATVLPATLYVFARKGLYRAVVRFFSHQALIAVGVGVAFSAAVMLTTTLTLGLPIPISVPVIYFALLFLAVGGTRFAFRQAYGRTAKDDRDPVAIYGAGESGRQLLHALNHSPEYRPLMFIDDDRSLQGRTIFGLPVMAYEEAAEQFDKCGIEAVLLAMPSSTRKERRVIIDKLASKAVEVKTLPGMADLINGKAQISELRNISIEELLGRDPVPPVPHLMQSNIRGKSVLVTGAGGSIGSELCRQIIDQQPKQLVLLDVSEFALYSIHDELSQLITDRNLDIALVPVISSVQNEGRIAATLNTFSIQTIYHAAAYKHVPLVEMNVVEGIRNNVFGTKILADAAVTAKVENFILISTDKAVRPTNFMGASKRLAELVCQAMAAAQSTTRFSMVRFGNVLGSSGSVIPRFTKQIEAGGPITVTHRDINRFFMTIPEAAALVIQAGSMAKGGDVFVLDMGQPVKIVDMAVQMARLHGLVPYFEDDDTSGTGDIAIRITGLRPGEKLYEELLIGDNPSGTAHPRIMTAHEKQLSKSELELLLDQLMLACKTFDVERLRDLIQSAPTGFNPSGDITDLIWSPAKPDKSTPSHLKVISV
ncbi:nucleoside-diphosphate sugar epimerase [Marivivens niveibacter]|uniref:Nucleoside-diphosphate sugar epimerase n=1 Tax=Marivivens niveibacter TaxID=1930667 RepID=A0A251WVI5_9RHOB|nr:nucleoside-diphosphate sugar epimerase/dehydratase [Marivivens niveibacter]OUD08271.1 nucleoside-diphosphate sugar epimerase [Marivivens niveibacter]